VARLAVKLLLLDANNRLLLIHARDAKSQVECWYPVGGGVEPGETLQEAASRETLEETGLADLPLGIPVWRRDHTYDFNGQSFAVHEEWLLHRVDHFDPTPTHLSDYEARSILDFRWWEAQDLATTTATIFPPRLGHLLIDLLTNGVPPHPITITEPP
jgi:8-oxo-dGTP pyrophosphatase MutT (NUDIX family)